MPKMAEAICSLVVKNAVIEGEAVELRPDGHSDFAALLTKAGSARACLVAFDLLSLNDKDLRQQPIEERRGVFTFVIGATDRRLVK
jgi:bifunctional non-homologous end joining protein LigD